MSTGPVIKGEDRPHGFTRGPFTKTTPLPSENVLKAVSDAIFKAGEGCLSGSMIYVNPDIAARAAIEAYETAMNAVDWKELQREEITQRLADQAHSLNVGYDPTCPHCGTIHNHANACNQRDVLK